MTTHPFEILDTQVHMNAFQTETAIATMDAMGIGAVVIDEFTGFDHRERVLPGRELPGGALRSTAPYSEAAVAEHPERFAYITRVDPDDPELDVLFAELAARPGLVGVRLIPFVPIHPFELPNHPDLLGVTRAAGARFAEEVKSPRYERYFSLAEQHRVPVFLQINGYCVPGDFSVAHAIAARYPELILIIDHTGMELPVSWESPRPDRFGQLPQLLELASFSNISLKWAHGPLLSEAPYPFPDVQNVFHRVVETFGVDRVMWASDWTVDASRVSWYETLGTILDDDEFTTSEKAALLGGTARSLLDWPRSGA